MYHNHVDKDYSHPWYTPERFNSPDEGLARMAHNEPWLIVTFPLYGWSLYLFGMPDGSHYFPFSNQRLWKEATSTERYKCLISTAVVLVNLAGIYTFCGNFGNFAYYYLVSYLIMGWWLVTVTYLQHHSPDTLCYGDEDWKFVDAAFETVDRKFGFGLDYFSHHITDGHVAHHLFFTKIPHYNLPMATKAIKGYLAEKGLSNLYKYEETYDFVYRVHKYFVQHGFRATKFEKGVSDKKKSK
jgi:omega-3 fatty acid desaturase (delta-15 desaturase)